MQSTHALAHTHAHMYTHAHALACRLTFITAVGDEEVGEWLGIKVAESSTKQLSHSYAGMEDTEKTVPH